MTKPLSTHGSFSRIALLTLATVLAPVPGTAADSYPDRAIRLVVPVPPGGASDFISRLTAQRMAESLGQNFVVDNRGGAAGRIASELVARATPDGYTLLVSSSSTHGMGPVLYKKLPYDPMKSFTHIALIAKVPAVMVVNQAVPAKSVKEFVELTKSKPNAISFGSSGGGSASRLFAELFKLVSGAPMTHVPYKGSGLATVDLGAGNIQVMFDGLPSHMAQIRAGRLRVLAALGPNRSIALPDVPTIAEAGYPGIECALWFGVSGPADIPAEAVTKISREVARISAMDDIRTRLATVGAIPSPLGPADYASFIQAENAKWGKVVAASGASGD